MDQYTYFALTALATYRADWPVSGRNHGADVRSVLRNSSSLRATFICPDSVGCVPSCSL